MVTVKVRKKKRLEVEVFFADTGAKKSAFISPFQKPAFKDIQVRVQGSDVVLTARKGKKTVTTAFAG